MHPIRTANWRLAARWKGHGGDTWPLWFGQTPAEIEAAVVELHAAWGGRWRQLAGVFLERWDLRAGAWRAVAALGPELEFRWFDPPTVTVRRSHPWLERSDRRCTVFHKPRDPDARRASWEQE